MTLNRMLLTEAQKNTCITVIMYVRIIGPQKLYCETFNTNFWNVTRSFSIDYILQYKRELYLGLESIIRFLSHAASLSQTLLYFTSPSKGKEQYLTLRRTLRVCKNDQIKLFTSLPVGSFWGYAFSIQYAHSNFKLLTGKLYQRSLKQVEFGLLCWLVELEFKSC